MATNKHIVRIKDTQANCIAGMEDGQSALETTGYHHIHRIGSNFYYPALCKYTADGVAFTYCDETFDNLTANTNMIAGGAIQHLGDLNTQIVLTDDNIAISAGGVSLLTLTEDTQDSVTINSGSVDVDTIINANGVEALRVDGATGTVEVKAFAGNGTQTEDAAAAENVTNGTFTTDTGWTKLNATISGGKGNFTDDGSFLSQAHALTEGTDYTIQFTIASNNTRVTVSGDTNAYDETKAPGTYSEEFTMTAPGGTPKIWIQGTVAGASTIDDLSIRAVSKLITPTHLAIEVTNALNLDNPEITLVAGSLPVNSIIGISCIEETNNTNLQINSTGNPVTLSDTDNETVLFFKTSIGWLPITGQQTPS